MRTPEHRALEMQELAAMPWGEEKARYLEGNYALAAKAVYDWYARRDYLSSPGAPSRAQAYRDEYTEWCQERVTFLPSLVQYRAEHTGVRWERDPLARLIWHYAGEAADVLIVGASRMRAWGISKEMVMRMWAGQQIKTNKAWLREYTDHIADIRKDLSALGLNVCEAVIQKLALNEQHYSPSYLSVATDSAVDSHGGRHLSFARKMRQAIGDPTSSQMPYMDASQWGELPLSVVHKSPYTSSRPTAIYTTADGKIHLNLSDREETYGVLYTMTRPWSNSKSVANDRQVVVFSRLAGEGRRLELSWNSILAFAAGNGIPHAILHILIEQQMVDELRGILALNNDEISVALQPTQGHVFDSIPTGRQSFTH